MGSLQRPDNGFSAWISRSPFSWDSFQFYHIKFFISICVGPAALRGSVATVQATMTGFLLSLPYVGLVSVMGALCALLAGDSEGAGRVWWQQKCQEGAPPSTLQQTWEPSWLPLRRSLK